jgi:hypothetical protein
MNKYQALVRTTGSIGIFYHVDVAADTKEEALKMMDLLGYEVNHVTLKSS